MEKLDFLIKKLFSNFVVKNKKVIEIRQTSPFRELFEIKKNQRNADSFLVNYSPDFWNRLMGELKTLYALHIEENRALSFTA